MAKYTLDDIMCGEKYNIESDVFMVACELLKRKVKPADICGQLLMLYVKETIKTTIRMLKDGDSISDISELQLPSLHQFCFTNRANLHNLCPAT